jgi:NadR type nicotinamide-nucleotide adenylyltransferase
VTRRIVVTGSESTGKTTLARSLAIRLSAPLVPEASRQYAESPTRATRPLTAADVEPIARLALQLADAGLATAPAVMVLDTDLISTVVYARHYYGQCAPWIEAAARERRGDLYLLCATDLPWVADGVRDRPEQRAELDTLFRRALDEFGCTVHEVAGSGSARERAALHAIAPFAPAGHH